MRRNKKSDKITYVVIVISIITILLITFLSIIDKRNSNIRNSNTELELQNARNEILALSADIPRVTSNLPINDVATPQPIGTSVAPEAGWNLETVKAVSVGDGNTVPVPIGFYYVGGTINNGVIISDNADDEFDGITDKTTWEYTTSLKGNQFVWIPCTEEEYVKCSVWNGTTQTDTVLGNSWWDTTTYSSELPQIRKYGGFYVARYEAGLAETIPEFTSTQKHTGSNQIYNKEGIPQSKAGVIPWMFIDWNMAQKNAGNMYNTASVSSGLITGTQWDVMLKKIAEYTTVTEADFTNSQNIGNYMNNSISYTGRKAKAYLSSGAWYLPAFGQTETSTTGAYSGTAGDLLSTGASSQTETYHLYDVAGNLWEWTEEESKYNGNVSTQYRVLRGGSYLNSLTVYPVCYRHCDVVTYTNLCYRIPRGTVR